MHLFLVRHAMAQHNLAAPEDAAGQNSEFTPYERLGDTSLTRQGRIQAFLAAKRLRNVGFDYVLSSPLQRALSTAQAIMDQQDTPCAIECLPDLMECGCRNYSGMPEDLLRRLYPRILCCGDMQPTGWPRIYPETDPESLLARAHRVKDYLLSRFGENDKVLVVTHGAFMGRYLFKVLLDLPDAIIPSLSLGAENASVTKMTLEKGRPPMMMLLNDTSHLGKYVSRDLFTLDWHNVENAVSPLAENELAEFRFE